MSGLTFDNYSLFPQYTLSMTVTVLIHTVSGLFFEKGSKCHYSAPYLAHSDIEG